MYSGSRNGCICYYWQDLVFLLCCCGSSLCRCGSSLCRCGSSFIVKAETPHGQISNHYELKDWDLFKCEEREICSKYDGHSPKDAMDRMYKMLSDSK